MENLSTSKDKVLNTKWTLDHAHSEITFKVRHMMISQVKGEFKKFDATIWSDGNDFSHASVEVEIDALSISTNNEYRDNHLKSGDFFGTENFKTITFIANKITKVDDGDYELKGILTIRGISKEIKLDVELGGFITDPDGKEKVGFSFNGKVNRHDFEVNWNAAMEAGGVVVGDDVKISGEAEFFKESGK